MFRTILFQLHWFFGISAGIVLALIGLTGGLLSFEHDILRWMNPGVMSVTPDGQRLEPAALLRKVQAALPDRRIDAVTLSSDAEEAATINIAGSNPNDRRGENRHVAPYSGELLGKVRGEAFFHAAMRLHRWLMFDDLFDNRDLGKQITGVSVLALILLALSVLYLRWPRRVFNWRSWLAFSFKRKGRGFLWEMHSAIGTWMLAFYLLAALTGLYWSYDWYRNVLHEITGAPLMQRGGSPRQNSANRQVSPVLPPEAEIESVWALFQNRVGDYSRATLRLPRHPKSKVYTILYLDPSPPHERAFNRLEIDPVNASILLHDRYAERPFGAQLIASIFTLHSGSYFGLAGQIAMMTASLAMPLFVVTGWMLYLDRRRNKRRVGLAKKVVRGDANDGSWLIAYASQSGTAEQLAWQSAAAMQKSDIAVSVRPLGAISAIDLTGRERVLFVAATFGDGEAPVNARTFVTNMMTKTVDLSALSYALLALGDRQYPYFCGFGRELEHWLSACGARPLFASVEMDNNDTGALMAWQKGLYDLCGAAFEINARDARFQSARLLKRTLLNPGSCGLPTFHLEFAVAENCRWQAGDLAEIAVGVSANDTTNAACRRQYSIASIPESGGLHLLVRQVRHADGGFGKASGWLTSEIQIGDDIALRIRGNPSFHGGDEDAPSIFVGNGTGLAGLRGHLQERLRQGRHRNWLIFGERNADHDFYYRDEILAWLHEGHLARLDTAFSRDQEARIYVQQRLIDNAETLRAWLEDGAAVFVCGSAGGMAGGVENALIDIIGQKGFANLLETRRFRCDVY